MSKNRTKVILSKNFELNFLNFSLFQDKLAQKLILRKYKHEMYYVYKEISYMHPLLSSDLIGMGYIKLNFSLF